MSTLASLAIASLLAISPATANTKPAEPIEADTASSTQVTLDAPVEAEHLSAREIGSLLTTSNELPPNCWFQYVNGVCIAVVCNEGGQLVILPEPCSAFGG